MHTATLTLTLLAAASAPADFEYIQIRQFVVGSVNATPQGQSRVSDKIFFNDPFGSDHDFSYELSVDEQLGFEALTMSGAYRSSFDARSMNSSASALYTIAPNNPFDGSDYSGSIDAVLQIFIQFTLTEDTLVRYSLGVREGSGGLSRLDDLHNPLVVQSVRGDDPLLPPETGTLLLTAGSYQFDASGSILEFEREPGSFDQLTGFSGFDISLEVIPAPGTAAWLLGGGLLAARRRR